MCVSFPLSQQDPSRSLPLSCGHCLGQTGGPQPQLHLQLLPWPRDEAQQRKRDCPTSTSPKSSGQGAWF
jgi:hypothetical protein